MVLHIIFNMSSKMLSIGNEKNKFSFAVRLLNRIFDHLVEDTHARQSKKNGFSFALRLLNRIFAA